VLNKINALEEKEYDLDADLAEPKHQDLSPLALFSKKYHH
jgi:hypothetical protein